MDSIVDAVRPIIQPITANLPAPIVQAGETLIGADCYQLLVLDFQPLKSPECVKLAVSKALGIGIIGASSIVKVPQLIALIRNQSAAGLSFFSYLLETTSYVITFAYNARQGFPFSTYGESALIAFQNVLIGAALLHYSKQTAGAAAWVAAVAVAVPALLDARVIPENAMSMLQAGAGLLGVASKVPQILAIFQQGSTGVLSAFAVSLVPLLFPVASAGVELILISIPGLQLPCRIP
jgi:mannose-P-dolichol utilization defect 1